MNFLEGDERRLPGEDWTSLGECSGGSGAFAQFVLYDAHHFGFGCGFAGPDFELARALLYEHFKSADDRNAARFCQLEQRGLKRVVDHVENEAGIQFVFGEGERLLCSRHAQGGGVDNDIEALLGQQLMLERFRLCLTGESDSVFVGAVDDQDFSAVLDQAEDGGTGGAAGSEDSDAGAFYLKTSLEGADDAGNVGVESVELSIRAHTQGVAGTDARGERVHVGEVR